MKPKKSFDLAALLLVASLLLAACATSTPTAAPPEAEAPNIVLAIEHFSPIAGTTWSGAHDRAGQRLAEKYPNVTYVYRESVAPDQTNPFAEELIASGANIVIGNAEFMGLPLIDIADQYPEVYFGSVIASDATARISSCLPQTGAALEGLIAAPDQTVAAITSAFPNVQVPGAPRLLPHPRGIARQGCPGVCKYAGIGTSRR
jgi:simple sugar transport system substrate-binding protein